MVAGSIDAWAVWTGDQQKIADAFSMLDLIPKPIRISNAVALEALISDN